MTEDGQHLEVVARKGGRDWNGRRMSVLENVSGRAFRMRLTQITPDARLDPDYVAATPSVRGLIAVPITSATATYGVITLASYEIGKFGPRQAALLESFADHAASTISVHTLIEQLRAGEARLRGVLDNAAVFIFATDRRGICTYAGGSRLDALWADPAPLVGHGLPTVFRVLHPSLADAVGAALRGASGEVRLRSGSSTFVVRCSPVHAEGPAAGVTGMIAVAVEVSEIAVARLS